GHGVAAPFATRILGDLGADVIKVEKPSEGDYARRLPPVVDDGERPSSLLFRYLNWNKRSVALNLHERSAQETVGRIAGTCDVVIDGFRPGRLATWGLGFGELAARNHRIVVV